MAYETDKWKFVQARFHQRLVNTTRKVRLIVIHSMESAETGNTAENCAEDFRTRGPKQPGSSHLVIDNNSIIQCVKDGELAAAAPGANQDGLHIELAGRARQTEKEWLDDYGQKMLELAADATAQYCLKYDIPVRLMTDAELANKSAKGICGHAQVSRVFRKSSHTDPGPGFPWGFFINRVRFHYDKRVKK